MNKVLLTGNLARDPEVRYTQSGKAVASFSLAVNRRFGKANDGQQPSADFISIVAWEKLAEFCGNYLTKGSRILVEGRLQKLRCAGRLEALCDGSRRKRHRVRRLASAGRGCAGHADAEQCAEPSAACRTGVLRPFHTR